MLNHGEFCQSQSVYLNLRVTYLCFLKKTFVRLAAQPSHEIPKFLKWRSPYIFQQDAAESGFPLSLRTTEGRKGL